MLVKKIAAVSLTLHIVLHRLKGQPVREKLSTGIYFSSRSYADVVEMKVSKSHVGR